MRRSVAIALTVLAVLLGLAAGAHLYAEGQAARSRDARLGLSERVASAVRAGRVEPWRRDFRSGYAMVRGEQLLREGQPRDAETLLKAAFLDDLRDVPLRALLREANLEVTAIDSRKAHQQHGLEGPGGTLRPQDVQR